MENLLLDIASRGSAHVFRRPSPHDGPADSDRLADSVERAVRHETDGGVRDLRIEVRRNTVRLSGRCRTFYTKQRAQHAAMKVPGSGQLINEIEVD